MSEIKEAVTLAVLKTLDNVEEMLPEGMHTALRKACNSRHATDAWQAIRAMPDAEWSNACDWAIDPHRTMWLNHQVDEIVKALEEQGFTISKKETANVG